MTHHGRYSQRNRLNRQELDAVREREQTARDMAICGHDEPAAGRARQLDHLRRTASDLETNLPVEHHDFIRQTSEEKEAEIRASGPVGCTCGYWRCAESRPRLDEK